MIDFFMVFKILTQGQPYQIILLGDTLKLGLKVERK